MCFCLVPPASIDHDVRSWCHYRSTAIFLHNLGLSGLYEATAQKTFKIVTRALAGVQQDCASFKIVTHMVMQSDARKAS